ncbi:MAG: hypothetical protein N3B16_04765 [Candidatus Aminicenantes bacterium]|nr:hypothetical protein [Candidatus Aminicenantes bacterium]
MEIRLTTEQYEVLIKLIYLGQVVIDTARESERDFEEYDALASYIYSYAPHFGFKRLVDFDEAEGVYYPSEALEKMMFEIFSTFAATTFFNQLASELADRDLLREYGQERINQMNLKEIEEKRNVLIDKYLREFAENGVQNLIIDRIS